MDSVFGICLKIIILAIASATRGIEMTPFSFKWLLKGSVFESFLDDAVVFYQPFMATHTWVFFHSAY